MVCYSLFFCFLFLKSKNGDTDFLDSNDYAIVPLEMKHFDMLEWQATEQIFLALNFRGPKQGEIYWRIPGLIRANDAEIAKEEFNKCFDEVESNPETKDLVETAHQMDEQATNHASEQEDADDTSEYNNYQETEIKEQDIPEKKDDEEEGEEEPQHNEKEEEEPQHNEEEAPHKEEGDDMMVEEEYY